MAEKKVGTKKTTTAKAAPVAKEAVKPVAKEVAKETVKEVAAAAKKDEKKTEVKAAPAKAAEKKPVAAKTAEKKAPAKKAEVKADIILELDASRQYTNDDLVKILKDVWKYDLKRKVADIKKVEMYVKPYENSVWYKVNDEVEGEFGI